MPTLEQLFKNRDLGAGQTAEQKYAVRNANKIELSSNSPVINSTSMKALNRLRSGNGSTLEETLLEQETTGLRVLNTLSQPLLYGAETLRITTRTTKALTDMRASRNGGDDVTDGLLGGVLSKVSNIATKVNKFLGIPQLATPTYVKNQNTLQSINSIQGKNKVDYAQQLIKIRDDARGTGVGGLLAGALGGQLTNPDQLKKKLLSGAIGLAKGFLRKQLIGGLTPSKNMFAYDDIPTFKNGVLEVRNYGRSKDRLGAAGLIENNGSLDASGMNYSTTLNLKVGPETDTYDKFLQTTDKSNTAYVSKFYDDPKQSEEQGGIISRQPTNSIGVNLNKLISSPIRNAKISDEKKKARKAEIDGLTKNKNVRNNPSSFGIALNSKESYEIKDGDTSVDDLDSVVLKFESVKQNKAVNFLATITGLGESFSPSWSSNKFIGNPFSFYTYDGLDRSVTFTFKVFSVNPQEHISAWNKVNFLSSLVYPQAFESEAGYVAAPFLKLTIGDLYKRKEGFIESLGYSFEDGTPWEIGGKISSVQGDIDMKGYVLPRVINIDTTFKFIEQRSSVEGGKYYSFGPTT